MPNLHIISGCNRAGKTTASYTILPEILNCKEFVNADEIAKGLSPFNPENVAIEAGRIMLTRIKELLNNGVDFAFETTLATRSYATLIKEAQKRGYFITLIYFWLNTPELAINRVNIRVSEGGHFIDDSTIRRRYAKGIYNLFKLYQPVCDHWIIVDNSNTPFEVIATGGKDKITQINNALIYNKLKTYE